MLFVLLLFFLGGGRLGGLTFYDLRALFFGEACYAGLGGVAEEEGEELGALAEASAGKCKKACDDEDGWQPMLGPTCGAWEPRAMRQNRKGAKWRGC